MGLFDSIYNKITENEKARLMEEEKLRDEIIFMRNEVANNTFSTQNVVRNFKNLEEQNLRTNAELQEFNNRLQKWQEEFLTKYSK
jgi:molecular chaperone GrpE (heat shock protein)